MQTMPAPPTLHWQTVVPFSLCRFAAGALLATVLAACGGGGNGDNGGGSGWRPGVFMPSASFAAQCVAPRTGRHPTTGTPWPDIAGTRTDENNFLRSWSNETYLWYDEITDQDPALFDSSLQYFDELRS